jgi:GDP-L-fucose synthase
MKIVVTGATGFLGRNLVPLLQQQGHEVIPLSSRDGDLTELPVFRKLLTMHEPNLVIHLAGLVGGIQANRSLPADYFYINQSLTTNLFEAAKEIKTQVFVTIGGCSYPANAKSPISENQMWDGYPQLDSAPFSVAKKTAITAASAYRQQYGLDTKVIVPGNMYGPFDNFRVQQSHVVPALIRKFYEAKMTQSKTIQIWGSGRATRDFVYVGDVASMITSLVTKSEVPNLVNLSSGSETKISDLAQLLRAVIYPEADLDFDLTAPEGQLVKIFATDLMKELGLTSETSLESGLRHTYSWLVEAIESKSTNLRW